MKDPFIAYPAENDYIFYLPQVNIFDESHLGAIHMMDIHIYSEPSPFDTYSYDHRFVTFHCNGIKDHDSAWVSGLELINLFRGLVTIFNGAEDEQKHIKIEKMENKSMGNVNYPNYNLGYDVNINPKLYERLGGDVLMKLNFKQRQNYKEQALKHIFNGIYYIAQHSMGTYLLLKYFSESLSWSSLYKIMETLETLEKHYDKGWKVNYSREDRKKFTNPANNYSLIGIDSRHGFKKDSLDHNNYPLMSLIEAKKLFIGCSKSYLEYKFNELKLKA